MTPQPLLIVSAFFLTLASKHATVLAVNTAPSCVSAEMDLIQCGNTCLRSNITMGGTSCAGCENNVCVVKPPADMENGIAVCSSGGLGVYCSPAFSDDFCANGTAFCNTPDEYCWNNTKCIPSTYPCGGIECPNNPDIVCNLDKSSCENVVDICSGIRGEDANCADKTSWGRWTLAGDGIATKTTADICGYPEETCNPQDAEEPQKESGAAMTSLWAGSMILAVMTRVIIAL